LDKWDVAHLKVAETYAELSSAKRLKVGAVIVKDNRIISIGYNGMPSGWTNECEHSTGIYALDQELVTKREVIHAESNAITKVAKSTESAEGAVLYTTCSPCLNCAKLIHQAGISRVVYGYKYKATEGLTFLEKCGIILETNDKPDPIDLPWQRNLIP
jgi:dCMP deaminase|tara:strand:- start:292 stop:765 length:474 start_codon:yes stop_codon:yes gene_type:complete